MPEQPAPRPHRIDFRYAPPSRWTLLCHPDDATKSLLREDGALLYGFAASGFDTWHFDTVLEFTAQTTRSPSSTIQTTESAARPIVHTIVEYPDQRLELITFRRLPLCLRQPRRTHPRMARGTGAHG